MAHDALHDLTPGYALDALDENERAEYEAHLATCEQCRDELARMQDTVGALAYAVHSPAPPPELRARIVGQARAERGNVVPFRPRRRLTYALGAVAAAAAVVALAVGLWASSLSNDLDQQRSVVAILADPQARQVPMEGGEGRVVLTDSGDAALVTAVPGAPSGKTYEVWVIEGDTPHRAGTFQGDAQHDVVRLNRPVPAGATVAVTIEPEGGVDAPTSPPVMSAST
jgi:anti-sigma-K factor RskA